MKIAVITKYEQQFLPVPLAVAQLVLRLSQEYDVYLTPQTPASVIASMQWSDEVAVERTMELRLLAEKVDAVVVIGGDGTMLGAAREVVASCNKPLIGVNQGRVGFITDIALDEQAYYNVHSILQGEHIEEKRILLQTQGHVGLNDVNILRAGAKMLELDVSIDNRFAYKVRADGLLISTPTGSTAYNLSSGGSIVSPHAKVFTVTPLMPQSLTNRPLIIDDREELKVHIAVNDAVLYVDGLEMAHLSQGTTLDIGKHTTSARFWHPKHQYNYLETLRTKLGWHNKP